MKKRKPIRVVVDHPDLRRWCIEQAVHWPSYEYGGYPQAVYQGGGGGAPRHREDADVIVRAQKIYDWVTASH